MKCHFCITDACKEHCAVICQEYLSTKFYNTWFFYNKFIVHSQERIIWRYNSFFISSFLLFCNVGQFYTHGVKRSIFSRKQVLNVPAFGIIYRSKKANKTEKSWPKIYFPRTDNSRNQEHWKYISNIYLPKWTK